MSKSFLASLSLIIRDAMTAPGCAPPFQIKTLIESVSDRYDVTATLRFTQAISPVPLKIKYSAYLTRLSELCPVE